MKIYELTEHLKDLKLQKKQMEDAEIVRSIRSMKLGSRDMLALLDSLQNGTVYTEYDEEGNLRLMSQNPEEVTETEKEKMLGAALESNEVTDDVV